MPTDFAMSSSYNSRPRVAEVMVTEDLFEVVRERETIEKLVKGERIASFSVIGSPLFL